MKEKARNIVELDYIVFINNNYILIFMGVETLVKVDSQEGLKYLKKDDVLLLNRIGGSSNDYYDTKIGKFGKINSFSNKQDLTLRDIVTFPFSINVNDNLELDQLVKFYYSCREIQGSDIIKNFEGFYFEKEFNYVISVMKDSGYEFVDDLYVLR